MLFVKFKERVKDMSDGIKIIAEDENSDKAQTSVGLKKKRA